MTEHITRFDDYAEDYDSALDQGLSVSGERKDFFARSRIDWLARNIRDLREQPRFIMDYGCGTGSATPSLLRFFDGREGCTFALQWLLGSTCPQVSPKTFF